MEYKRIESYQELENSLQEAEKSYLLLYKSGSEQSDCAIDNLQKTKGVEDNINVYVADVATVRDIHPVYNIKTVPSLIEFNKTTASNVIKGCHKPDFFKALFENAVFQAQIKKEGRTQKSVTVYSTPSCPWCNTLKSYLRDHKIAFRDVDVSKDQQAAQDMMNKSGQQGVPQTEIDGEMIIGFDQSKINQLLGIK